MRAKQILGVALLLLVGSAGLAVAQGAGDVEDTFYAKSDIEQVVVRESVGKYWVVLLLKQPIGDFEGFYFFEFASLQEALTFGDLMRKGKIKGVQHWKEGTGQTATWDGKRIAIITRWYFFNN